jgi:hypothetical protein
MPAGPALRGTSRTNGKADQRGFFTAVLRFSDVMKRKSQQKNGKRPPSCVTPLYRARVSAKADLRTTASRPLQFAIRAGNAHERDSSGEGKLKSATSESLCINAIYLYQVFGVYCLTCCEGIDAKRKTPDISRCGRFIWCRLPESNWPPDDYKSPKNRIDRH